MMDLPAQQKSTPARRRQGRKGGQKAYASENDAAIGANYHHGTPQTPEKLFSGSPGPQSSKQRTKGKPRPRNMPTSPDPVQPNSRQTPPRAVSMKSGPTPAFAGATFHASPAPGSLPIPSFLSKVSTQSPAADLVQQPSPPATDTEAPSPYRPAERSQTRESPLDFMFRAHRQEQERHRQDEHGFQEIDHGTASPPTRSPFGFNNSNRTSSPPQSRRPNFRRSASGIDSAELDGTPGQPMGPAFSTPYQDRIKAARSGTSRPEAGPSAQSPLGSSTADDPTEALKKFLFGGGTATGTGSPLRGAAVDRRPGQPNPTLAHEAPTQGRPSNIEAMENDLRRILKLDVTSDAARPERTFYTQ